MGAYQNVHGRKSGRGLRPWLLIPKVLCVAAAFGGYLAAAVLAGAERRDALLAVLDFVVLPGLIGATLLGAILVAEHGTILLRMRWMQVKLLAVLLLVPVHLWLRSGIVLHAPTVSRFDNPGVHTGLNMLTLGRAAVPVVLTGLIVWLGRHKPRLGQNVATVYQKRQLERRMNDANPDR
jgi:uncharacterized membrane protein